MNDEINEINDIIQSEEEFNGSEMEYSNDCLKDEDETDDLCIGK